MKYIKLFEEFEIKNIIYTGLFLDSKTRNRIIKLIKPKFDNIILHHITIAFKPTEINYTFGGIYNINIIGICEDDNAQALLVEKIPLLNNVKFPHVTYSLNENISPVYSNKLIENSTVNNSIIYFKKPIKIKCKLGYFDGKEVLFENI